MGVITPSFWSWTKIRSPGWIGSFIDFVGASDFHSTTSLSCFFPFAAGLVTKIIASAKSKGFGNGVRLRMLSTVSGGAGGTESIIRATLSGQSSEPNPCMMTYATLLLACWIRNR